MPKGSLTLFLLALGCLQSAGTADSSSDPQTGLQRTQQPSEVSALMGLLENQLRLKQSAAAQQSVQTLKTLLSPKDPRFFQVASLCAIHQDYAMAIPLMQQVRAAFPRSYDVNYNLALAYFQNKNYVRATETLTILLSHEPRPEAYNLLATVEEQRQHYLEAVRAFQKAAELDPGNEDYRYDYAFELLKHQTDRAAIAIFASGVRDFPKSFKLHLGLGSAYYMAGKQEEAAQTLLEAIKIEPNNKLAYMFLGKTYEQAGSFQAAVGEAFKAYMARDPQDPWAHSHYGRILYLSAQSAPEPDFHEAKSHLHRALSLNPRFAEAYIELAVVLQTENQNKESLPFLHHAIQSNPKLASAHYRLGLAYQRLGEKDKAAAEFTFSKKLNTEDEARQEKRRVIQFLVEQRR